MYQDSTPSAKVSADHLRRGAYLYIRQSSLKQVVNNTESTQRQYALRGRAVALGWREEQITVIDTDQGRSGASTDGRDGFAALTSAVSLGLAGIVLGLEVSRLARNNADWHRLLEICALTCTLILDEDGLYDPRTFNDRLVLGMKGTMSEAELHLLGARLRGGQLSKARRGELKQGLPIGYLYDPCDRVVFDPDSQIRGALERLFATFARTGSARAVVTGFARDRMLFPAMIRKGPRTGEIHWEPLKHWRVLSILHNPCYAGAFCYGRRQVTHTPGGKTGQRLLPRGQWDTLIEDHHPGYISFAQWEANTEALAANAQSRGEDRKTGPAREGPALLQGLVICARCGRRMTVGYRQYRDQLFPDYRCMTSAIQDGARVCQRIPGHKIDQAVETLLLGRLTPWPSRRPSRSPTRSPRRPTKPTGSGPDTSPAPNTAQISPGAATSRSTRTTGWSPTPSKPTGTPRCAKRARPATSTNAPAPPPNPSRPQPAPAWPPSPPTSTPCGTTRAPSNASANASPDC